MRYTLIVGLISRCLPGAKLRNYMHACVSFNGWITGYGNNESEGVRPLVSEDFQHLTALRTSEDRALSRIGQHLDISIIITHTHT